MVKSLKSDFSSNQYMNFENNNVNVHKEILNIITEDSEEKFKTKDVHSVKAKSAEDVRIASQIQKLKMWEDHVIAHERMHMIAGGGSVGAPSYSYTVGPDGKRYITGGEVTLYVPNAATLEGSEVALEKLKRAATAPSDPSPQDLRAAAMASSIQNAIRAAISRNKMKEAYEETKQQEVMIKEQKGETINALEKFKFQRIVAFELMI
jgi:hypothetical protein